MLPRTMSRWLLNIAKEGDSVTSLGNLGQCSVILTMKKRFLMFRQNLLCFSFCPLPPVLSLKRAWPHPFSTFPSDISIHWWDSSQLSLLQAEQSQLSQPFLTEELLWSPLLLRDVFSSGKGALFEPLPFLAPDPQSF